MRIRFFRWGLGVTQILYCNWLSRTIPGSGIFLRPSPSAPVVEFLGIVRDHIIVGYQIYTLFYNACQQTVQFLKVFFGVNADKISESHQDHLAWLAPLNVVVRLIETIVIIGQHDCPVIILSPLLEPLYKHVAKLGIFFFKQSPKSVLTKRDGRVVEPI